MDSLVTAPSSYLEAVVSPWPVAWAYGFFTVVGVLSLVVRRNRPLVPKWWRALPVVWFGWQILSAALSPEPRLGWATVCHFGVCIAMFFIGLYSFSSISRQFPFWMALMGGFFVILLIGWRQHFGGLEETRRFLYTLPNWESLPPEFLKKVGSDRIYSTLVYPNAFAGALLLLTPIALVGVNRCFREVFRRRVAAFVVAVMSGGCLYWSGSKAGWLIAIVQLVTYIFRQRITRRLKLGLVLGLVAIGLLGFGLKYREYFDRGATSLSARYDYWVASLITIKQRPILGYGPGTFAIYYKEFKKPESEMTRLAHNDYLQQASDSGVIGGLTFATFWLVGLTLLYRKSEPTLVDFGVFIGLLGVALQSLMEFGTYIPGIAWPAWLLFGWFVSKGNRVDKASSHS